MEPRQSTKMQMFNRRELVCGIISFLCYVGSFCCFCAHLIREKKRFDWKVEVGSTIYVVSVVFTSWLGFQKFGCIRFVHISAEVGRASNLVGPFLGILGVPLLEGEYKNLALYATLLGTISFASMLMFIAPITSDFGLLNVLCAASIKLSWENENADILVWERTGIACAAILIIRYLVDREVRMRTEREVQMRIEREVEVV